MRYVTRMQRKSQTFLEDYFNNYVVNVSFNQGILK